MAFRSLAVPVLTTDTTVFECPATLEGALVLAINNVAADDRTFSLRLYKQSEDETTTFAADVVIAANALSKFVTPLSLQAGDQIIATASNNDSIVVTGTITINAAVAVATGFTPRGTWSSVATYDLNDIVAYEDIIYLATSGESNVNQQPDETPAFWMVLLDPAEIGAVAPEAITGATATGIAVLTGDAETARLALGLGTSATRDFASTADFRAGANNRVLGASETWAAGAFVALTDAGTVAVNMSLGLNFSATIAGNRTLGNPSSAKVGQTGVVKATATGASRTLNKAANWIDPTGRSWPLTIAQDATTRIYYQVEASDEIIIIGVLEEA